MPNELKQFAEKVTGLRNDKFQLTRLRLTGIYAVLLLAVLVISAITTHSVFSNRLEARMFFRGRPLPPPPQILEIGQEARAQARQELITSMILVNGTLFIGAVGLSYILAGLTLRPIKQAYEQQRRFLSDASHELRTPLAILQTDLENELDNTKASTEEKENAQSHLEEVQRMGRIVKDLLLISRLDGENQLSTSKEAIDLNEIVTATVKRLQGYATKHNIKVISSPVTHELPVMVTANKEHILQAISNLIKNGIDHNKPNGNVVVSLRPNKTSVDIIVSDTGIGIAEEEIPKLFDRFYRVDQSRSREKGGSGLGLSIVQAVIHNYGGSVNISSKPGEGTTVTLTLPIKA
ncbi:MAG: ATP-binding protein [Candidatus Andersenbacteria bacterium]|nr:ATP-binding protein [Candidatus Andersenbacteria bacterium]MBI3250835.1 ATP-binding protein [Candidatus Andersenbacteria bacterium]